jgi:uncharacterized protein (DUF305 family)
LRIIFEGGRRFQENHMKKTITAVAIALTATAASAQMQGMNHGQMNHDQMMQPTPANPYPPAEMKMHEAMMGAVGSDATETWVRKMIEHHRGGIETSRIVLRNTRDAKVRQMASKTITDQTREVGQLQAWLRSHGKRAQ